MICMVFDRLALVFMELYGCSCRLYWFPWVVIGVSIVLIVVHGFSLTWLQMLIVRHCYLMDFIAYHEFVNVFIDTHEFA